MSAILKHLALGAAAITIMWCPDAAAQTHEHYATMSITARLIETTGAQISLMQPLEVAPGIRLPVWAMDSAHAGIQGRALLKSRQHAPVTVVFNASGSLSRRSHLTARVFSRGAVTNQRIRVNSRDPITVPIAMVKLHDGESVHLLKGSYYFDIIGDISVRDTSDGVYDAVVTLTLIYN